MNPLDIFLIILIILLFFKGYLQGFVSTVGSFLGIFIGWLIAAYLSPPIASFLSSFLVGNDSAVSFLSFFLFFILFFGIIELAGWIFRLLKILTKLPFLKTVNSLLGGFLGFFLANLILGLFLFFATSISYPEWLVDLIESSTIAPPLIQFSKGTISFLPGFIPKGMI